MLRNRRDFLEQGYYSALADKLAQYCVDTYDKDREAVFSLLDVGCGEGYFTAVLADQLNAQSLKRPFSVAAIDISKHAVRMAAKRYRHVVFAVASSAALPVADRSVDCLVRVFAPAGENEIRRVLKPDGYFVRVTPGPRHLYSLRRLIYDNPIEHDLITPQIDGFVHKRREILNYQITLCREGDVGRLLSMTPYVWQASQERRERIAAMSELAVEVSFCIDIFRSNMNG